MDGWVNAWVDGWEMSLSPRLQWGPMCHESETLSVRSGKDLVLMETNLPSGENPSWHGRACPSLFWHICGWGGTPSLGKFFLSQSWSLPPCSLPFPQPQLCNCTPTWCFSFICSGPSPEVVDEIGCSSLSCRLSSTHSSWDGLLIPHILAVSFDPSQLSLFCQGAGPELDKIYLLGSKQAAQRNAVYFLPSWAWLISINFAWTHISF